MLFWIRRSFPNLPASIGDSNEDLIVAYGAVRDDVDGVVAKLETHAHLHSKEHYYAVRAKVPHGETERAARFIYLNRTCYNGLYRVNRKGLFNVPMGRYDKPRILDRENILAVSTALRDVELKSGDFGALTDDCGAGDLVTMPLKLWKNPDFQWQKFPYYLAFLIVFGCVGSMEVPQSFSR